jgi:hypothetical protein
MVCTWITRNGVTAVVCGPRQRRKPCVGCGASAPLLLCDWKLPGGLTCDAPICMDCTISPAPGKDLCPIHAKAFEAWKAERASA